MGSGSEGVVLGCNLDQAKNAHVIKISHLSIISDINGKIQSTSWPLDNEVSKYNILTENSKNNYPFLASVKPVTLDDDSKKNINEIPIYQNINDSCVIQLPYNNMGDLSSNFVASDGILQHHNIHNTNTKQKQNQNWNYIKYLKLILIYIKNL